MGRRVVDHDVKTAEGGFGERHQSPRLGLAADVCSEAGCTTASAFDEPHCFLAARLVNVGHDDRGSSSREPGGDGATAPRTTGSGDNDDARVVLHSCSPEFSMA